MKVFVSYRRSDSQDIAARIVDRLGQTAGITKVFFDVDSIAPGTDFTVAINTALEQCDVCLILVGANWRGISDSNVARLDDENDYVRQETAIALASGKRVIPVLLNNIEMPALSVLPADNKPLATLNAAFLRHQSFNQDLELLEDAIFARRARGRLSSFFRRHPALFGVLKSATGIGAALVFLVIIAIIHKSATGNALNQTVGDGGALLLILVAIIFGAALPLLRRG